jgi:hypothetical protein
MAFSGETRGGAHKQLTWSDFAQALQQTGSEKTAVNIARCLRYILERFEESEFITYLVIPSPSSMALYFQIPVQEVYQAMQDLEQQGYQTESSSHYAPILLWDPLIHEKTQRHLHVAGSIYLPHIGIID